MLEQPTVVVINNEPTFRWTVSRLLSAHGFAVKASERGPAALDDVRDARPAAVILETSYGGAISATSIVERMRADRDCRYLPIIVCSPDGKFLNSYGEYLRGQGCVVIGRPFIDEQFVELVERSVALQAASSRERFAPHSYMHSW